MLATVRYLQRQQFEDTHVALEDLTGAKYISDLNPDWPLGSDYPTDGDDHLRGIKNVLQRTFPALTGPVTLSQAEINRGVIESGAICIFYQAAAPTGWTRVSLGTTYGVKIQPSTSSGGTGAGTDDPVLNNKVPSHAHTTSGNTGNQSHSHDHYVSGNTGGRSAGHYHYVSLGGGGHEHAYTRVGFVGAAGGGGFGNVINTEYAANTTGGGGHVHAANSGTESADHHHGFSAYTGNNRQSHYHYFSLNSGGPHSATVGNWVPRHLNCILCQRS